MTSYRSCRNAVLAAGVALACLAGHAQIVVGQTVGVTGPVAATVKESMAGARIYSDWVNATVSAW